MPSAVKSLRLCSVVIGRFPFFFSPFLIRNPARTAFVHVTIDLICFDSIMFLSGNAAISAFLVPLKKKKFSRGRLYVIRASLKKF